MKIFKIIDRSLLFVGKGIKNIIGCLLTMVICFFLFLFATEWIWPEYNGSYSLGNNIYMLEWDGGGRVIVQGSNIHGNTCYGGIQLIPTYENQYDSLGNFAEYVIDAKADDNWIIAKTDNKLSHRRKYYIIKKNKDIENIEVKEILKKYTMIYTDSFDFAKRCKTNGINIKW